MRARSALCEQPGRRVYIKRLEAGCGRPGTLLHLRGALRPHTRRLRRCCPCPTPSSPTSGRLAPVGFGDERLQRDAEAVVKLADHVERELALAAQDLRGPSRGPKDRQQILSGEPLLVHAEL